MELSPQQDEAMRRVSRWFAGEWRDKPFFFLGGFAGTGKTTIAQLLAAEARRPAFVAPTGKAAHVMRSKGCAGAATIHSQIYRTRDADTSEMQRIAEELEALILERPGADPRRVTEIDCRIQVLRAALNKEKKKGRGIAFTLNPLADIGHADLIICDEGSMVDARVADDLLSFQRPILVLGDPAQLPPVGGAGYFTRNAPDYLLTEIHRQAANSPVLHLATKVRKRERLDVGHYGTSRVVPKGHPDVPRLAVEADQIIVGRNKTRHATNDKYRQLRGFDAPTPLPGDKLVCLRNDNEAGLLNGSLWRVQTAFPDDDRLVVAMTIAAHDEDEGGTVAVDAWLHHFLGREDELVPWTKKDYQEFDFGYAITCHKSQGSQWDNVYVLDESRSFGEDSWRWQYTAITRAAESVTVVQL